MNLTQIFPFLEKSLLRVVVETPKGSRNKFSYDPKLKTFLLKKTLPEGMVFPYDFGFIPRTRGNDGDPLDILVLMPESACPGSVVDCRLVGVMQGEQKPPGEKAVRNDRFLAASVSACEFNDVHKLDDLPSGMLKELEGFFINYNRLEGKSFKVLGVKNGKAAWRMIKAARVKA